MKKSLFYWAFLVVAGMSLTACSSGDDNIADNTTPVTPDSQNKTVILTGTIGVGGDETRAVDNDGKTSWEVNNEIAINYQKTDGSYARTSCTITEVSSDKHFATFTATLNSPKDDGYIGFAYPFDKVNGNDTPGNAYNFEFNYDAYATQNGATTGTNSISDKRLDYACTEDGGEVKMAVKDGKATLKSAALLKNQFSMYEFTLKDGNDDEVDATELKIFIKSSGSFSSTADYTVTPNAATSKFYVALEPTESTVEGVKIVASFDNQDAAIKLNTAANVAKISDGNYGYGKFICVDEAAGAENQAYLCSSENSAYYCEHIYSTSKFVKGKLYSANLTVKDLTPTAVIAYTGAVTNYCDNFIALALSDATTGNNVVTLGEGQASVASWLTDKSLKINDTTYPASLSVTNGRYDDVKANPQKSEGTKYFNADNPNDIVSNESATSMRKGWRLPTVTDFRRIFSQLKDNNDNPVMTGITATNPKGIMDHNGVYGYYTGTYNSGGFWTYPYKDAYDTPLSNYYRGSSTLLTYINHLFSTPNSIQGQYYWLGSGVIEEGSDSPSGSKGWRYSFNNDYFVWNEAGAGEGGDKALIRLVFAY